LPIYIHLLRDVPALQLLAHRVLWSLLLLLVLDVRARRVGDMLKAARGRTLLYLLRQHRDDRVNWIVYIWSVQNDHVLEASLGYFINPLVNIALGMLVLGERLRRCSAIAITIAAAGVLVMAATRQRAVDLAHAGAQLRPVRPDPQDRRDRCAGRAHDRDAAARPAAPRCCSRPIPAGTSAWGVAAAQTDAAARPASITAIPLLMFAAAARLHAAIRRSACSSTSRRHSSSCSRCCCSAKRCIPRTSSPSR
jgi:chloramphenicol-sensitive protein RarD